MIELVGRRRHWILSSVMEDEERREKRVRNTKKKLDMFPISKTADLCVLYSIYMEIGDVRFCEINSNSL